MALEPDELSIIISRQQSLDTTVCSTHYLGTK